MQKSHTQPESLRRCLSLLACPNFAFSNRS
jgi:hypothetical protein